MYVRSEILLYEQIIIQNELTENHDNLKHVTSGNFISRLLWHIE